MSTNPTLIPNIAMSATVAPEDMTRRSERIKGVPTSLVHIDTPRMRRLDAGKVNELAVSIKEHGLLQPIGVQQKKAEVGKIQSGYRLIYGRHRLAAIQQLFDEEVPGADTVPCVIYPSNMSENAMLLDEIIENLHRKELTPVEKAAHTTMYAGLLKKMGVVQDGRAKSGQTRTKAENWDGAQPLSTISPKKPSVTERIGSDFGISRGAVQHRIKIASKVAEREGVKVESKTSPDAMSADMLISVAKAAQENADKRKVKAMAEGKAEHYVNPLHENRRRVEGNVGLTSHFPKSLDKLMQKQWEDPKTLLTADLIADGIKILQYWENKWRERERAK